MWPLSRRRSNTFSMSKLGYLASRAPRAMFSKSRNTAIVASEVRVVLSFIVRFYTPQAPDRLLEPVVIEADAHPFGRNGLGGDFMAQPTLEQDELPRRRRDGDPRAILGPGVHYARGRGHEAVQTWILKFDSGRPSRDMNIVGTAQRRERMQVQTVRHLPRHDVDPAIGHRQFAALEVPLHGTCERLDMSPQLAFQGFKRRGNTLQPMG